jgi:hypothetical protein
MLRGTFKRNRSLGGGSNISILSLFLSVISVFSIIRYFLFVLLLTYMFGFFPFLCITYAGRSKSCTPEKKLNISLTVRAKKVVFFQCQRRLQALYP